MRTHKLRVWDFNEKRFQFFDLHNITVPDRLLSQDKYPVQPFIGLLDKNMTPIYEGDVVQGLSKGERKPPRGENPDVKGEVQYSYDLCAYVVDWYHPFSQIETSSLEILGNMMENYIYNETGQLVKQHT